MAEKTGESKQRRAKRDENKREGAVNSSHATKEHREPDEFRIPDLNWLERSIHGSMCQGGGEDLVAGLVQAG